MPHLVTYIKNRGVETASPTPNLGRYSYTTKRIIYDKNREILRFFCGNVNLLYICTPKWSDG